MKKIVALIIVTALTITCALCLTACQPQADFNVGICQLLHHDALDEATKGFRDALTEELQKAGKTVHFDEQNAQGDSTICSTIVNTFVTNNVDLIMANATAALQAAANATLTIPVLGTSITSYEAALEVETPNDIVPGNISGTSDLAPLDSQADMIKTLVPSAQKVGILYCSAEANSAYQVNVIKGILTGKGLTCKEYSFTDSNDISAVATTAMQESDVVYVPTDNTAASCAETIRTASTTYNTPVVAGEENLCKTCGIATLSISYYNIGVETGKMAARILLGTESIDNMPVSYDQNPQFKYNEELCELFDITVPNNYVAIGE